MLLIVFDLQSTNIDFCPMGDIRFQNGKTIKRKFDMSQKDLAYSADLDLS